MQAALEGSREIGFTIVSMTISLAAVFIPVLFMGGVLGRLFREFAVTICASILISGVVSITLTPMMCSRFLRSSHENKRVMVLSGHRVVLRPDAAYLRCRRSLWVLRHRFVTLMSFFVVLAGDGMRCSSSSRRASFRIRTRISCRSRPKRFRAPASPRWPSTRRRVAEIVNADPDVESLVTTVGGPTASVLGGPTSDNWLSI